MEEFGYQRFAALIASAAKDIQRIKKVKMEQYGLSAAHTTCLCKLRAAGAEGLTQGQLMAQEQVDRAQISRVLRELTDQGYTAVQDSASAYKRRYSLTAPGIQAADEINAIIAEVNAFVSGQIPAAELSAFYRTMEQITANLHRAVQQYT